MKLRAYHIWTLLLICTALQLQAQQNVQFTQYLFNPMYVNPAYAGSREVLSIAAMHRSQWVGLDGAPETSTLNLNSPVGYSGMGMGFSVVRDRIGPTSDTFVDLDFSYQIQAGPTSFINFGFKASGQLLSINFDDLNQDNTGGVSNPDPLLQVGNQNTFSPNVGVGVFYFSDLFYLGLSAPRILETKHFDSFALTTTTEAVNLYLMSGYVFELRDGAKIRPSILTRAVEGSPLQVDLTLTVLYWDKVMLGANYRLQSSVSGMVGFRPAPEMLIGLTYERDSTPLGGLTFNDGSFEIVLRYDFVNRFGKKYKFFRFF